MSDISAPSYAPSYAPSKGTLIISLSFHLTILIAVYFSAFRDMVMSRIISVEAHQQLIIKEF
jgi:hypothetical protein